MAKIEVTYEHSIKSEPKLRGSIWTALTEVLEIEFNAKNLFIEDDSGDINFNFTLGGVSVKGVVQLYEEYVDISLKVPFGDVLRGCVARCPMFTPSEMRQVARMIATMYRGKIIEKLNEKIPEYLKE